jgi:hypothetical protein
MENNNNNTGQGLGIAALITAIITFVLAVIPCVGLIAIFPGIISIVLASIGLSQAVRSNSPRGLMIAGLVVGLVATIISISQIFVAGRLLHKAENWPNNINNIINDVQDNVIKEIEDANVNIKVESNGDKIEINANKDSDKNEQEKTLENLENGNILKSDSSKTGK